VCAERFGSAELSSRSFAILGLGRVGADLLHERGILWAPDLIVSAGGPRRQPDAPSNGSDPATRETQQILAMPTSCRRIEPPVARRIDRIVRSALHHAEKALVAAEMPNDEAGNCVYRGRMENRIRHRNGPPSPMGA
jgi:hypothetical protein